jgi:hypothetical protein
MKTSIQIQSLMGCQSLQWLLAAFLISSFAGCSFSVGSGDLTNVFKAAPKWSPENFSGRDIKTLAIVVVSSPRDRQDSGLNDSIVSNADQEFTRAALNKGYDLVSRARIQEWQKEVQLQNTGLSDLASVAKAGKMLNASHLLAVTPTVTVNLTHRRNAATGRVESYYSLRGRVDCQIMEVETARTIAACSDDASNTMSQDVQDVLPLLARLNKRVATALPARDVPPASDAVQGVPKTR